MKLVVRFFNLIILALSGVALFTMFAFPTLTFASAISLDVSTMERFVPETEYSDQINIKELLGTDRVNIGIKFAVYPTDAFKLMSSDKDTINETFLTGNIKEATSTLHQALDLITDYSVRSTIKSTIRSEITKHVENAIVEYDGGSTAEDILEDVGMDDQYFTDFANALYDSANADGATIDTASNTLYQQVDKAIVKAEETSLAVIDTGEYTADQKANLKTNLSEIFNSLNLVNEDGTLKKISQISYIYISDHLKQQLDGKVSDPTTLNQKVDETIPDYSDRLLNTYVLSLMPNEFYTIVGFASIAIFVGIVLFTIIWGFLFIFTLIKTFTKRPWTIFGAWFFVIGTLQLVLGLGVTIVTKVVLPNIPLPFLEGTPIKSLLMSLRTCVLIPSIVFLVMIIFAIIYTPFKVMARNDYYEELQAQRGKK